MILDQIIKSVAALWTVTGALFVFYIIPLFYFLQMMGPRMIVAAMLWAVLSLLLSKIGGRTLGLLMFVCIVPGAVVPVLMMPELNYLGFVPMRWNEIYVCLPTVDCDWAERQQ